MKKLGILGAALAVLLFAVSSQATTIGVSYKATATYTSAITGATHEYSEPGLGHGYKWWNVSDDTWASLIGGPVSNVVGSFGESGLWSQLTGVEFSFDFYVPGVDQWIHQEVSGVADHGGMSLADWQWTNSVFELDLGDGETINVALEWEENSSLLGSYYDFFLQDPPVDGDGGASSDNGAVTAVPAPGVLSLFALALALLGAAVCVRQHRGGLGVR